MSTVVVAAVLTGIIAALCLLLLSIDRKQKRKAMHQLLQRFSQIGSEYNLTFSGQEVLHDCILGLDGVHRKLLVLETWDEGVVNSFLINLNEVKSCVVRKQYGMIRATDFPAKKLEQFLQKIVLRFELQHEKQSVEITFFNNVYQHVSQIAALEKKAKHWEAILSKMLTASQEQRA